MGKKVLVAAAWPYANGSLHLGHVAGLIGGDVLARYYRLKGDDVLFVSGSDCHGTPIAVEADKQGVHPSEIANKYHAEFSDNFLNGLSFSYDNYTKTTTDNHRQVVQEMFLKLYQSGDIYIKEEELPYCSHCQRFLPDRYVEGECYICGFSSARGDQCDNCGNLMETKKLKNPKCKTCGSTPEWKTTEHFFLKLSAWQDKILKFIEDSFAWRQNAKNFSREFVAQGLLDRAITRDTEWGVPIPLDGYESKRIYVWFEAVLGYLSASKEWAKDKGDENLWQDFWQNNEALHYYVHGKDNIPFHAIILPTILMSYGNLHLPDRIISSEYLNLEGKQFSKSRGHAVWLKDFLAEFDSDTLRYYLISNGPESSDANFSWADYMAKTNNELIGNFGNFVFRTLSFVKKNFPEGLDFSEDIDERLNDFLNLANNTFAEAGEDIELGNFKKAIRAIFKIIEDGNRLLNELAPWTMIKSDKEKAANNLAAFVLVIKSLAILIEPFLPQTSIKIKKSLLIEDLKWQFPAKDKLIVGDLEVLYQKIETEKIEEQLNKLSQN
ncbi:MAG: methionine--tRNA ligase [Patescibacteria group bacterium]